MRCTSRGHFLRGPGREQCTGARPYSPDVHTMLLGRVTTSTMDTENVTWCPVLISVRRKMDPRMKTRILLSGVNACGLNGGCTSTCVAPCDLLGCNGIPCAYRTPYATRGLYGERDIRNHVWHTGLRNSIPVNTGSYVHRQSHEVSIVQAVPPIGCSGCLVAPRVASKTYSGAVLQQHDVRPRSGTSV